MSKHGVDHDTFVMERTYKAAPERVFAAWADPVQKRRWFAEGENWTVESFEADFRVGGFERSRFRFKDGPPMGNDTFHHDIVPNRRVVSSYSMTIGDQRISTSLLTLELEPEGAGTRMRFTEQAAFFAGGDGTERRREGWTSLLERLARELGESPGKS
jgi:uncharacterized protein YndB with AHSA1/START domain